MQYLTASFKKSLDRLSWGTGSTIQTIGATKIQLPTKNDKIEYDFMGDFITELEAYLIITGLKNYDSTDEEVRAL